MEFLGKLGIDGKILIAQLINFGLLLWFLKRFLYKPLIERIEKDEKILNASREEKHDLKEEQNQFAKDREEELRSAHKEAQKIIVEAETIAESIRNRAKEEMEKEKKAVIDQIHSRLDNIKQDEGR